MQNDNDDIAFVGHAHTR